MEPDLALQNMTGTVKVTRTPQGLLLQVKLHAQTQLSCVRCLEDFDQSLAVDFSELYAFDHRSITESGLIMPESGYINLAPLLREFMLLEVPISPICYQECRGLCSECGVNLNVANCEHQAPTDTNRPAGARGSL